MVSTKGRYAIRFMLDLAMQPQDSLVPLDEIAQRQGISKKYLEIVVKMLVNGKLVKGVSGKGGGYRLLREPKDYSVLEILELTEGPMNSVACLSPDAEKCDNRGCCRTLPMWMKFDRMVHDYFVGISLQDLADGKI